MVLGTTPEHFLPAGKSGDWTKKAKAPAVRDASGILRPDDGAFTQVGACVRGDLTWHSVCSNLRILGRNSSRLSDH